MRLSPALQQSTHKHPRNIRPLTFKGGLFFYDRCHDQQFILCFIRQSIFTARPEPPERDVLVMGLTTVLIVFGASLLATVLLSHGTPMLLAGDEFARSQNGNNNAYCQDNETNWIDWALAEKNAPLLALTQRFAQLRAQLS